MNTTSFPSLQEQGKNLAKFTFNVVKDSISITSTHTHTNLFSTKEKQTKRLNLCQECDYYYHGRCRQCGCFMEQKVKLNSAKCPMGIW